MNTPKEVALLLENSGLVFTTQQAQDIAEVIYQPLKDEIDEIKRRLDALSMSSLIGYNK